MTDFLQLRDLCNDAKLEADSAKSDARCFQKVDIARIAAEVEILALIGCELSNLSLSRFSNISSLVLTDCGIQELPDLPKSLRNLNVARNQLTGIPSSLNLLSLEAQSNKMLSFEGEFPSLAALTLDEGVYCLFSSLPSLKTYNHKTLGEFQCCIVQHFAFGERFLQVFSDTNAESLLISVGNTWLQAPAMVELGCNFEPLAVGIKVCTDSQVLEQTILLDCNKQNTTGFIVQATTIFYTSDSVFQL